MIAAGLESFGYCLEELKPLLEIHWQKLALNQDKVRLDPQYDVYLRAEASGELMFMVLRDAGKIAGYWIAFIRPGLHYRTCLTAQMDIWNLLPGYEGGMAALVLMRAVHREYERRGVQRSFIGEKLHMPTGRLFKAFGYEPVETYHSKWLGA